MPLAVHHALEALFQEFRTGCPLENLCDDDLVIIFKSLEKLPEKLILWKFSMGEKGLQVSMNKTKDLISGLGVDVPRNSSKIPCVMCLSGIAKKSIFCDHCPSWNTVVSVALWSPIPPSSVKDVLDWPDLYMADQRQKLQCEGRSLWWCNTFATSGITFLHVEAVLPFQEAVLHGTNSRTSCPSSPPAHLPSHPELCLTQIVG